MVFAEIREIIQKHRFLVAFVSLVTVFNIGLVSYQVSNKDMPIRDVIAKQDLNSEEHGDEDDDHELVQVTDENGETYWTCSMHPQIKLPKPGKCPICFMDLIPLEQGAENLAEREVVISEYAKKLLEIETIPVERKAIDNEIRLVGKVDFDDTRVVSISAVTPGLLENMPENYTGIAIQKGQSLANLQYGITGKASKMEDIVAPISGQIIKKYVHEGDYVKAGAKLFTMADLSTVWVNLDAYESDLRWIKIGSPVEFSTETWPDKKFTGTVTFIEPTINEATRTANIRVVVNNADLKLKPGMFVKSVVYSSTSNIFDSNDSTPLVIPASSVLLTGKRAIVYIETVSNKETGGESSSYEGRVVTLGPRAGDYYLVADGLSEGDKVVVKGAFKLDAELQLQARPSMMSEEAAESSGNAIKPFEDLDPEFRLQMEMLFIEYEAIHKSLSGDDPDSALIAIGDLKNVLSKIPQNRLDFFQKKEWKKHKEKLLSIVEKMALLSDLEKQRIEFEPLTEQLIKTLTQFPPQQSRLYLAYCSMTFNNKGARWIQREQQVINPYYGSFMLYCGEIADELSFPALRNSDQKK